MQNTILSFFLNVSKVYVPIDHATETLLWQQKVCKKTKIISFLLDIEAQIREIQGKKAALDEAQGVGLDSTGYYDQEIYGGSDSRFAGYVTSIAATELEDVSTWSSFWAIWAKDFSSSFCFWIFLK